MSNKLMLLVLAVFAFFASTALAVRSDAELRSAFGSFVTEFDKKYASAEEYESRYQIFVANMYKADQYNKKSKTATFGVTQFSDWSTEERKAYLGRIPSTRKRQSRAHKLTTQAPLTAAGAPSFDLSGYPVQNQGQCGSCWAFSTTAGVASAAKAAGYPSETAYYLSQQQLVDCDQYDAGCNGGDLPSAFDSLVERGGYMSSTDYPYTARDGSCKFNKTKVVVPVKGFDWVIPTCENSNCDKQDTQQLLNNVAQKKFAPSICVYVSDSWFDYTSGVFDDSDCSSDYYDLNHCILLTGYNEQEGYVRVQNSWGKWGEGGFMNIKYDKNTANNLCGWADEVTFAVVA